MPVSSYKRYHRKKSLEYYHKNKEKIKASRKRAYKNDRSHVYLIHARCCLKHMDKSDKKAVFEELKREFE